MLGSMQVKEGRAPKSITYRLKVRFMFMGLPHGIADFERIRKQKEVVAYVLIVSN